MDHETGKTDRIIGHRICDSIDYECPVFHNNSAATPPTSAFAFPTEGNAPEIAAVHNSAVLVGGELPDFFTKKLNNMAALAKTAAPMGCPAAGLDNTFTVPRTSPCVGVIRGRH